VGDGFAGEQTDPRVVSTFRQVVADFELVLAEPATASLIVSVVLIISWLFFFTKSSVRTTAFTYAETLL
jgi:hypothetical protein